MILLKRKIITLFSTKDSIGKKEISDFPFNYYYQNIRNQFQLPNKETKDHTTRNDILRLEKTRIDRRLLNAGKIRQKRANQANFLRQSCSKHVIT